MPITCFIRYQIDPFQREAFRAYAQAWLRIIPRCGGSRARIKSDAEGRANFAFAQDKRFILREERTFLENLEPP